MIDLMKLPATDAERLAYAEGFTGTATLLARLADAERERDALNEQLQPLVDALYLALPFVEDHLECNTYKPDYVKKAIAEIRKALKEPIQ